MMKRERELISYHGVRSFRVRYEVRLDGEPLGYVELLDDRRHWIALDGRGLVLDGGYEYDLRRFAGNRVLNAALSSNGRSAEGIR